MAPQTVGRMQEFNPDSDNETVTAYLELFQLFVDANTIAEDKLIPTLLTVPMGSWSHFSRNTMIQNLSAITSIRGAKGQKSQ